MGENIKNKFGNTLRELVRKKYTTYAEAAEKLGLSLSYLQQLMRGERNPSFEILQSLSLKLGSELLVSSEITQALKQANDLAEKVTEQRKKRLEFLAWELNLDPNNREDLAIMEDLMPVLPQLSKIPADILMMLSRRNEKYFDSLRKVLEGLEAKKAGETPTKKTRQG